MSAGEDRNAKAKLWILQLRLEVFRQFIKPIADAMLGNRWSHICTTDIVVSRSFRLAVEDNWTFHVHFHFTHRLNGPKARYPPEPELADFYFDRDCAGRGRRIIRHDRISAKPAFIIQLCAYCDMLEAIQLRRPGHFSFVLGDNSEERFVVDEFFFYYWRLKKAYLLFQAGFHGSKPPEPGNDRAHGRWSGLAAKILESQDLRALWLRGARRLTKCGS